MHGLLAVDGQSPVERDRIGHAGVVEDAHGALDLVAGAKRPVPLAAKNRHGTPGVMVGEDLALGPKGKVDVVPAIAFAQHLQREGDTGLGVTLAEKRLLPAHRGEVRKIVSGDVRRLTEQHGLVLRDRPDLTVGETGAIVAAFREGVERRLHVMAAVDGQALVEIGVAGRPS